MGKLYWAILLCIGVCTQSNAQTAEQATNAVKAVLNGDPFDMAPHGVCGEKFFTSGAKILCRMAPPNQDFMLIGCKNPNDRCKDDEDESLEHEYETMKLLNNSIVSSAQVGPELIENMPCGDDIDDKICVSFVERHLKPHFMKLAGYVMSFNETSCANNLNGMTYITMDEIVQSKDGFAVVRQMDNDQKRKFIDDFNNISRFSMSENGFGIIDLQGFLQNQPGGDGSFTIIDPMGRYKTNPERKCFAVWTCGIARSLSINLSLDTGQPHNPTCMNVLPPPPLQNPKIVK